jgi:hypothetical protein
LKDDFLQFDLKTHKEKEMLDFRRWLPVLAVLALLVGFTTQANAQAFNCVANAGVPTNVRSEGLAELVGDVLLNCTGVSPVASFTANIQIFLNTNITSRILNTSTNMTEATLLIDDNYATPLFATRVTDNSVAWLGITVVPPGNTPPGTTRTFRITNVRANASQAGLSSTLVPNQIVMFISASGTQSMPINNPQQVVAFVQRGMDFVLRNCNDSGSASTSRQQCASLNGDLTTSQTATNGALTYQVKFSEGFASAFKVQSTGVQNQPGAVYNGSESGLIFANGAGQATQGTRLIARFNNIPAGVFVYATTTDLRTGQSPVPMSGGLPVDSWGTSKGISAVMVSNTDPTGTGGSALFPIPNTTTATCSSDDLAIAPVLLTGGAGSATWEITSNDPSAMESASFGILLAYRAAPATGSPALGTGTVTGNFAPVSTIGTMSAIAPVPRFADVPISRTAITISACVTRLLFPFVTNQGGFDTGIAISNTTRDPFGTGNQNGTCTLNYFGTTAGGGAEPAAQTSGVVNAGAQLILTLSNGGNLGIVGTPGFQGYIIAECRFQFAHAFAFISDMGAQRIAEGYLALILPTGDRAANEALDN